MKRGGSVFLRGAGHAFALALVVEWLGGVAPAFDLVDREAQAFRDPALHGRLAALAEAQGDGMNVSLPPMLPRALAALEYGLQHEAGKAIKDIGAAFPAVRTTTVMTAPVETGCW